MDFSEFPFDSHVCYFKVREKPDEGNMQSLNRPLL